jgi:adenine-specific DNA-methyltransferase
LRGGELRDETARAQLNRFEQLLMQVTRHELGQHAEFLSDSSFRLLSNPFPQSDEDIPLGLYELPRRTGQAHLYRLHHPLAENVLTRALDRTLPLAEIVFDYHSYPGKISLLEPLLGQSGSLTLHLLSVAALDQAEDHLIFAAVTDDGVTLDAELAQHLFALPAVAHPLPDDRLAPVVLQQITTTLQDALMKEIGVRNARYFEDELKKLDAWADDQIASSEKALKHIKKRIRDLRNEASKAADVTQRMNLQDDISEAERRQRKMRQEIFEVEDRINAQRDTLVSAVRGKLQQAVETEALFS